MTEIKRAKLKTKKKTYLLALYLELEDKPVAQEYFMGAQKDVHRRLSELWNNSPAAINGERYKAVATELMTGKQIDQIGGWDEEDEDDLEDINDNLCRSCGEVYDVETGCLNCADISYQIEYGEDAPEDDH